MLFIKTLFLSNDADLPRTLDDRNAQFRALVQDHFDSYSQSTSKMEKSKIVRDIIDSVRQASPQGGFVKKVDGVWMDVGERSAREKTGQQMRDLLHTQYRSSTKAKARNRQLLRSKRKKKKPTPTIIATKVIEEMVNLKSPPVDNETIQPVATAAARPLPKGPIFPGWRRQHLTPSIHNKNRLFSQTERSTFVAVHPDSMQQQEAPPKRYSLLRPTVERRGSLDSAFLPMSPGGTITCDSPTRPVFAPSTTKKTARRLSTLSSDLGFDELEPLSDLGNSSSEIKEDDLNGSVTSLVSEDAFEEALDTTYGLPFQSNPKTIP